MDKKQFCFSGTIYKEINMANDILLNKWFFTFITGWVVFLILVDRKTLNKNIWGGIICCLLELWEDSLAYIMGMYFFKEMGIEILNVSAFFTFGITLTMGILFMQFIPGNPVLQIIHLLAFNIGFTVFEALVKYAGILETPHWSLTASFLNSILIFGGILWFNDYLNYKTGRQR